MPAIIQVYKVVKVDQEGRLWSALGRNLEEYNVEYFQGQWVEPILKGSLLFSYGSRDEAALGPTEQLWLAETEGAQKMEVRSCVNPARFKAFWETPVEARRRVDLAVLCDYIGAKRLKLLERIS